MELSLTSVDVAEESDFTNVVVALEVSSISAERVIGNVSCPNLQCKSLSISESCTVSSLGSTP